MSFIAFHGTSLLRAWSIRRAGFREWTWFARHLEDAIEFGGSVLFHVEFQGKTASMVTRAPEDCWQFRVPEIVPPSRIVRIEWRPALLRFANEESEARLAYEAAARFDGLGRARK